MQIKIFIPAKPSGLPIFSPQSVQCCCFFSRHVEILANQFVRGSGVRFEWLVLKIRRILRILLAMPMNVCDFIVKCKFYLHYRPEWCDENRFIYSKLKQVDGRPAISWLTKLFYTRFYTMFTMSTFLFTYTLFQRECQIVVYTANYVCDPKSMLFFLHLTWFFCSSTTIYCAVLLFILCCFTNPLHSSEIFGGSHSINVYHCRLHIFYVDFVVVVGSQKQITPFGMQCALLYARKL